MLWKLVTLTSALMNISLTNQCPATDTKFLLEQSQAKEW